MALRPAPKATAPRPRPAPRWSAWVPVLRPRDLVALWVSWRGLSVQRDGESARLVAGTRAGLLRFRFDYQHLAEQAFFETPPDTFVTPNPSLGKVPVNARAAGRSRLIFKVPAGDSIDYDIEGLLAAMGRLELAVAPAATPAATGMRGIVPVLAIDPDGRKLTAPERLLVESKGLPVNRVPVAAARTTAARTVMAAANRMRRGGILDGVDLVIRPDLPILPTWKLPEIRQPTAEETAIEAPYRLLISPSVKGGWAHAAAPVPGPAASRVELWHTRLGVRTAQGVDEAIAAERIVRAIWTRDRDGLPEQPFLTSLTALDRERIVRQSAGTDQAPRVRPRGADVRRLALSSVGAWLDLDARWDWERYLGTGYQGTPLKSWEHVAPMGRDQWVRVATPGYLFPLGHAATLIKITYRKIVGGTKPQALLFQKKYIVVDEPQKSFGRRDLPFVSARLAPGRTPDLNDDGGKPYFWPTPLGLSEPFAWKIEALDHDGQSIHLQAPLLFVAVDNAIDTQPKRRANIQAEYASRHNTIDKGIPAQRQLIAFAPPLEAGQGISAADTSIEVDRLLLGGEPRAAASTPFLHTARATIPVAKRLTGEATVSEVAYPQLYKSEGFGSANVGNVFLELARYTDFKTPPLPAPSQLSFGSTDRSGGFIRPDVVMAGLARSTGVVSDIANAAAGNFDAAQLFGAGLPKLFGLFDLTELIPDGALDLAPKFVTEALDKVSALRADLATLLIALDEFAVPTPDVPALIAEVEDAIVELLSGDVSAIGPARIDAALAAVAVRLDQIQQDVASLPFQPMALATFDRLLGAIRAALASDVVATVLAFANGLLSGGELRAKLDWRPRVQDIKIGGATVLRFDDHDKALVVSVEAKSAGVKPTGLEVAAQLSDFQLILLPGASLMEVHFERIAFRASGARSPEIDIVFKELKFVGVLSFVEVLKELIPLDGFSDPPFLDVSAAGISAGFTVALPNLAIGVFSLTNLSLGADARVPFLGDVVSVGFNFCTRERPFTLAVAFLGGGGFLGIRLNPDGLVLLEGAFEFGAVVALDFGVASGSVSVMAGIYFKIEGDQGQLTGYVRIRGEVDVLGLISASLELYLALTYYTAPQDKLIGEATMTIKVEVLFFSTSVSVKARRVFAGSNGDPTVRQMLMVEEQGDAIWNDYWAAFAPAKTGA